jgi:hypothetical protein
MKRMVIHPRSGRFLLTPAEASRKFSCSDSYLRKLFANGELTRVEESPRRVFYFLDELDAVMSEKDKLRKERGGRPRSGSAA